MYYLYTLSDLELPLPFNRSFFYDLDPKDWWINMHDSTSDDESEPDSKKCPTTINLQTKKRINKNKKLQNK